jgi:coenzyme F420 hydrogenase subunit beta
MSVVTRDGHNLKRPYPHYCRGSIVPKRKRCSLCIDVTGELADFSCGDAWIESLKDRDWPWSILISRNRSAELITSSLFRRGLVVGDYVEREKGISSQKLNIQSKKYRQKKKATIYRLLGQAVPEWDTALPPGDNSYLHELRVFVGKMRAERRAREFRHLSMT